jgi:hypothetical protein
VNGHFDWTPGDRVKKDGRLGTVREIFSAGSLSARLYVEWDDEPRKAQMVAASEVSWEPEG